jgi:hypothetical protein
METHRGRSVKGLQGLEAVELALASLIASLEGGALPEVSVLSARASELERHFEAWRARGEPADEERAELEPRERCLRLYALALALLGERRTGLELERAACAAARRRVEALRAPASGGDACDVRG